MTGIHYGAETALDICLAEDDHDDARPGQSIEGDLASRNLLNGLEVLDERSRLLVDRDGLIRAASSRVSGLVKQIGWVMLERGRLQGTTNRARERLASLLSVGRNETQDLLTPLKDERGHVILSATGIDSHLIIIGLQLATPAVATRFANLRAAFGLTKSEEQIVIALLNGSTASEIAKQLGISIHTVRAHLRRCYDKLEVSKREELWQRIAPYRVA